MFLFLSSVLLPSARQPVLPKKRSILPPPGRLPFPFVIQEVVPSPGDGLFSVYSFVGEVILDFPRPPSPDGEIFPKGRERVLESFRLSLRPFHLVGTPPSFRLVLLLSSLFEWVSLKS